VTATRQRHTHYQTAPRWQHCGIDACHDVYLETTDRKIYARPIRAAACHSSHWLWTASVYSVLILSLLGFCSAHMSVKLRVAPTNCENVRISIPFP